MNTFEFADLFSGAGGFRLGMEAAGGRCVATVENNKAARHTYQHNFGGEMLGDIRQLSGSDLGAPDLITAGFPCQPFSRAGDRKGFADERSGDLFFHLARVISESQPQAFILENVPGLLSIDGGRAFREICETLRGMGYSVSYSVLDCRGMIPQKRRRVLIAGFRGERMLDGFNLDGCERPRRSRGPVLRSILQKGSALRGTGLSPQVWQRRKEHKRRNKAAGRGFGFHLAGPDDQACTITTMYPAGPSTLLRRPGKTPRKFSVRELARIQGFPDSFEFPVGKAEAVRQIGNALPPPAAEWAARAVVPEMLARAAE